MTDPARECAPEQKPFSIAICGGGITGVALAIGLLRRNVPFHIYESAHAFGEVGAGLAFGPNSLRAMSLIDPRIRERYGKRATSNAYPEKKEVFLDFHAGMDCGVGKAGQKVVTVNAGDTGCSTIRRSHFLDEMVALVPSENVTFRKKVVEVEELADGVRLHFADGGTADASGAVGCDGVKSKLRQIVLGAEDAAAHPVFAGTYAYRGLIPMEKAVALLGDELARNGVMWLGKHGHVLTFPVQKGEVMNVVAVKPKPDGGWPDGDQWVLPMTDDRRHRIESDFRDWGPAVRSIVSLLQHPDVWALFDHDPPARTYFRGRTCLCGDAAHASTPHQGAAAGMALEDAYVLSELLGALVRERRPNDDDDVAHAFRAYDHVRRPRTQRLVRTSREASEVYDLVRDGVGDDAERVREDLRTRFGWIWDEDLEGEVDVAMGLVRGWWGSVG